MYIPGPRGGGGGCESPAGGTGGGGNAPVGGPEMWSWAKQITTIVK